VKQRGFSAARPSEHSDHFPRFDAQADPIEHAPGGATRTHRLRHPASFQDRHLGLR
jgi:hypothetical protein